MPRSRFLAISSTLILLFIVGVFFGSMVTGLSSNEKLKNGAFPFIGVFLVLPVALIALVFRIIESHVSEADLGRGKIRAFAKSFQNRRIFIWAFDETNHIKKYRVPKFYTQDFSNFLLQLPLLSEMPQIGLWIDIKDFKNPDSVATLSQECIAIVKNSVSPN